MGFENSVDVALGGIHVRHTCWGVCRTWIPPKATPTLFSKPTVPPRPFDFSTCYMHATLPQTSCTFVYIIKCSPTSVPHMDPPQGHAHTVLKAHRSTQAL